MSNNGAIIRRGGLRDPLFGLPPHSATPCGRPPEEFPQSAFPGPCSAREWDGAPPIAAGLVCRRLPAPTLINPPECRRWPKAQGGARSFARTRRRHRHLWAHALFDFEARPRSPDSAARARRSPLASRPWSVPPSIGRARLARIVSHTTLCAKKQRCHIQRAAPVARPPRANAHTTHRKPKRQPQRGRLTTRRAALQANAFAQRQAASGFGQQVNLVPACGA